MRILFIFFALILLFGCTTDTSGLDYGDIIETPEVGGGENIQHAGDGNNLEENGKEDNLEELEEDEVNLMGKNILFIIAPENFRDEELFNTKEVLEGYDADITIASTIKGTCTGLLGGTAEADLILSEVNVDNFDAIIFVGGPGTLIIRNTEEAITISKQAFEKGKLLCAICWAPTILAKAGVLEGKKATVWVGNDAEYGKTTDKVLEQYGAEYVNEGVVKDGNIITADGPANAKNFGEEIAKALK